VTIPGKALVYARAQIGKPYKWGAEGPGAFDCSGLVHQSYLHAGFRLPDNTADGYMGMVRRVSRYQLQPGMLVFPHKGHVQLYAGRGRIVEAPKTGVPIREVPMWGWLTGGYFPGTFNARPYPGKYIRRGSTGADVRAIQSLVGATRDGVFGPHTESQVKAWQSAHKLAADGVVGPATWGAMFR
jgi:hypothetical protein